MPRLKLVSRSQLITSIRFGLITGFSVAFLQSFYYTAYDWWFNPGGLFRGPEGTAWNFVFDTASSWLLPGLATLCPLAFLAHLTYSAIKQYLGSKSH